jgi:hypothetical protein
MDSLRITVHSFLSRGFSLPIFTFGDFMSVIMSYSHLKLGLQTPCSPSGLPLNIIFGIPVSSFLMKRLSHSIPVF